MKKLAILVVLFLGGITAQANVTNLDHSKKRGIRYNNAQTITFVQKGVTFFVHTNGEFDFNRTPYRGRRGYGINAPGQTYGVTYPYRDRGFVRYDRWGNISKVGRNYINYNRRGRVNQIGNISLRYHKGQLVKVGNMQVIYDRWGRLLRLEGNIIYGNTDCGICGINGCAIDHFDYRNNPRERSPKYKHKGKRNHDHYDDDHDDD